MTKQLTTQNATITTATVEVKTLTISGKQVTLAVFRQLKEEPVITDDGTLRGEPWGIVNYHPDKCGDSLEHWHVVWQDGNELRRSHVSVAPDFDMQTAAGSYLPYHWHSTTTGNRYLTALVYMGLKAGDSSLLPIRTRATGVHWTEATPDSHLAKLVLPQALAGTDLLPVQATAAEEAVNAADLAERRRAKRFDADRPLTPVEQRRAPTWQETLRANRRRDAEEADRQFIAAMETLRVLIDQWGGFDEITNAYEAEIKAEEERRRRHRAARSVIAELPQLFIAV